MTAFYANEFCPSPQMVLPELIAKEIGLPFTLSDYGKCFDGYLQNINGKFHAFLDSSGGTADLCKPRVRFSLAHELGHFIIEDHHHALNQPDVKSHCSFANLDSSNLIEREADFFAACLLMPEGWLKRDIFRRKLNIDLIKEIAIKYNVSVTATLLRFIALGNHPIMVVCSKDGKFKWLRYSDDFPFTFLILGADNSIPENTSAGEYFFEAVRNSDKTEIVFAEDWFRLSDPADRRRKMNEYCIYQKTMNQVISVLWE